MRGSHKDRSRGLEVVGSGGVPGVTEGDWRLQNTFATSNHISEVGQVFIHTVHLHQGSITPSKNPSSNTTFMYSTSKDPL